MTSIAAHLKVIEKVAAGQPSNCDGLVVDSWLRCPHKYRLDSGQRSNVYLVPAPTLRQCQQQAEKPIRISRRALEHLYEQMIDQAERDLGPLDIAVNNAGIISIQSIDELSADDWDRIMAVNARGVFLCTQAEIRVMRPRAAGRIINIASIAGKVGFPDLSHYSASKFAVIGFTNAVAKEVAAEGITVNALCPGIIGTGMWRGDEGLAGRWRQPGESEEGSWARHQKTLLPQGEAQTPEDIGYASVYLAGADHVTGQAIAVDGGFSL